MRATENEMFRNSSIQFVVFAASAVLTTINGQSSADDAPGFSRNIQPLLSKHCVLCHGPDDAEAGLRLDIQERAYAKLDSGERAIVPGDPDSSEMLRRMITTDDSERMPPEGNGETISAEDIAMLRRWIEEGAQYEEHWAYQALQKPSPPAVQQQTWIRNPIDAFVLARLEDEDVLPSPEAGRATLIRRLFYDLIGLPPTPQQVDEFFSNRSPEAYENLVDELLLSKHFGERWGRHWLDKARYADSNGFEKDRPRPNAWQYRDWVIDSINRDQPFDNFTVEQLAGDLLDDATPQQKLATAFHRQTLTNQEGGVDQEEFRVEATFDRTETTSSVWMGMTMTCARCHSHKYDQISQREYYELFAFFNNANESDFDIAQSDRAMVAFLRDKNEHDRNVASLTSQYQSAKQKLQPEIDEWINQMSVWLKSIDEGSVKSLPAKLLTAESLGKTTELVEQEDGSLLVSGEAPNKDRYTLEFELPNQTFAGVRIEVLADDSLPANGPGRSDGGNFVLSELRGEVSDDRKFEGSIKVDFAMAVADFEQSKFPAPSVLSTKKRSGWAIGGQAGTDHQLTAHTRERVSGKYLRLVLDQQYGSKHTIGRFRVTTIPNFNPSRVLPKQVVIAIRTPSEARSANHRDIITEYVAGSHADTAKLLAQLKEIKKNIPKPPTMSVRIMAPATRSTHVLHRGDFLQPAEEVTPNGLAVISRSHPLKSREPEMAADRLDLARWVVGEGHPLTPRVTVNHVWAHLFGQGIVTTVNDFGVQGEQPSHPDLLDWLAWQFTREMDWSRKRLIKTIVMSATYRQSSHHRTELQTTDPTNLLLARQNRIRVEAEVVRDLNLSVSGLLSPKIGGPSVFPPLPASVAELSYNNNFKWITSQGEDAYRRGMYTFFKRTSPHPTLISFDCPDSNTTRLQRDRSNTPLQALATLNNDVYAEAAQALTVRVFAEGGDEDRTRLEFALRLCIARTPAIEEVDRFQSLLNTSRDYYQMHPNDAKNLTQRHAIVEIPIEENAAWVATLRMVLNLDEFIVRD